jgi:hypothetical protein
VYLSHKNPGLIEAGFLGSEVLSDGMNKRESSLMPPQCANPCPQPRGVERDRVGIAQQEQVQGGDQAGKADHRVDPKAHDGIRQQKQPEKEYQALVCQEQVNQVSF